ncbi:phytoene/squalene synthase family protein [Streptomyces sp. NPDC096351]|uniref:phytoene/squalene synthase family protein n=1 Tax=Streptomyces sp. NPDC096351 TaxID=3366087 RepID=UPI00381EA2E1
MTARELDAAGILDAGLRADYTTCRRLNARHGRTYFLATRLLPADRRSAVHALYGFARHADDIVDDLGSGATLVEREAALDTLEAAWEKALAGGRVAEPVVRAVADTRARYGIPAAHFRDFLASMRSDLSVTDYPTYADLAGYMHGSAAVIGLQMVPVLGTVVPRAEAEPQAAALGVAFQLTNFLRDVGEDLDRGRVYLPADLLAAHGVDRSLLLWSRTTGRHDGRVTEALKDAASLTRRVYRAAEPGIAQLHSVSAPCVRTAFVLYRDILRAIEDDGFSVLHRRAVVSRRRRLAVAGRGYVRAVAARRGGPGPRSGAERPRTTAAPPPAPGGETARSPRASRAGGEQR